MSQAKHPDRTKSPTVKNSYTNRINWSSTNPQQIFDLIDNILPLQDCISYQVIPLSFQDKHLTLGLVNLDNVKAIDRVRSSCLHQVNSISTKPIDAKTHQLILSAYSRRSRSPNSAMSHGSSMLQERPTLILDNPEEEEESNEEISAKAATKSTTPKYSDRKSVQPHLELDVQPKYMSAPPRFLASLPPQLLWKELLARILVSGNGRIHLERSPSNNRITWSQNGNVKLSIEPVSNNTLEGIVKELKRLVNLPNIPVKQIYKGELERYCKQERLLLLWRINPGNHGEEATLQVIRGKVLDLYQKRQIEELGSQAIEIAKQLERKLEQIHTCRRINSNSWNDLSSLKKLHAKISQQIKLLD